MHRALPADVEMKSRDTHRTKKVLRPSRGEDNHALSMTIRERCHVHASYYYIQVHDVAICAKRGK